MLGDKKHRRTSLVQGFAAVIGIGGTLAVAWIGVAWLTTLWLGILLTSVMVIVLHRKGAADSNSLGLLETPFYLSHDTEIFERYKKISQQMLRISQRSSTVFRDLALQRLDKMAADCTAMGQGQIIFTETETWRIAYEQLLRHPVVFFYHSVAIVRHPQYWQDAAGMGSMQLNFQLIDQQIVNIERIVVIADELWPRNQDLPVEELRQWIHEQSVHGIWIRLARLSDLRNEPDLIRARRGSPDPAASPTAGLQECDPTFVARSCLNSRAVAIQSQRETFGPSQRRGQEAGAERVTFSESVRPTRAPVSKPVR